MSEMNEESKRVEQWLTGGKPRTIVRTRGAVRTRGGATPAPGVTINRIGEVADLLAQLKEDIPQAPWVVVADGSLNTFVEAVCRQVKTARESTKLWLVGSEQEIPEQSALVASTQLRLNPQNTDDLRFIENLVADLAILSKEPQMSQRERLYRWLPRTRYILAEELEASLIAELRTPELASRSQAEVFLMK